MAEYNVVFASDIHYLPYTLVAAQSAVDSLDSGEGGNTGSVRDRLIFNIIIDDTVDPADMRSRCDAFILRNASAPADLSFEIRIVDKGLFAGMSVWGDNRTHSAYYRLLADRLLPEEIDIALYLDIDVMLKDDIRKLFASVDLNGRYLAAVPDYGVLSSYIKFDTFRPRDPGDQAITLDMTRYFNSGVILFNLAQWREDDMASKCLELAAKYELSNPDQDLLNYVVRDPVWLDPSWNMTILNFFVAADRLTRQGCTTAAEEFQRQLPDSMGHSFKELTAHPKIVHFNAFKPWSRDCHLRTDVDLPLLPADVWRYVSQWGETAARVKEYSHELEDAWLSPVNYFNGCVYRLNSRLEREGKKRRRDRNMLMVLMCFLFLISILFQVLD